MRVNIIGDYNSDAAAFSDIFPAGEKSTFVGLKQAPELPCRVVDEVEVIESSADASRPRHTDVMRFYKSRR